MDSDDAIRYIDENMHFFMWKCFLYHVNLLPIHNRIQ